MISEETCLLLEAVPIGRMFWMRYSSDLLWEKLEDGRISLIIRDKCSLVDPRLSHVREIRNFQGWHPNIYAIVPMSEDDHHRVTAMLALGCTAEQIKAACKEYLQ